MIPGGFIISRPAARGEQIHMTEHHEGANGHPERGDRPLFPLGRLLATPGAIEACERAGTHPVQYITRHAAGDWGDLDPEDLRENELALEKGFRLFSSYTLPTDAKLWVITEADRSATTALLPSEY